MASTYGEAPATDPGSVAGDAGKTGTTEDRADWPELHERGLKLFKLASEREADNRRDYLDDVRFARLGGREQWPDQIVAQRDAAGKPCLTINQMPAFIHQVINDARQNKPGITVRPVDSGADRWTAQIMGGLIRHIENISGADAAYDTAVDNGASGGFGYLRVVIDYTHDDSFDKEIYIRRVPDPLMVYGDPYSMGVDSRDWNDAFVLDWVPEEEFKAQYPDAEAVSFNGENAPLWRRDGEILKAEWWHRKQTTREIVLLSNGWVVDAEEFDDSTDGLLYKAQGLTEKDRRAAKSFEVCQYIMTGAEILEKNGHPGKYIPIIPCYGEEVIVEGKRHLRSMIRDGKDPQRNFNYWRSKASESAALAIKETWLGPEEAFTGGEYSDRWDSANTGNWPFLAYKGTVAPQRVQFGGQDPAAMQQAASAADDMNRTIGIYKAGLGAPSNEVSGRAINARKVEGDTGTFHFIDNLSRCISWLGNVLVDLIPHVYTPGRIVRVLGPDGVENHVTLGNRRTPPAAPAQAPNGVVPPALGGGAVAPVPQQTPKPMEGKPDFGQIYDLGLGKYDVVVSAGPGYQTRRQESADQMLELIGRFPQLAAVIGDIVARNLDWPGADEIEQRMKKLLPPQLRDDGDQAALTPQMQQAIQQGQQLIQRLSQALQQCQAELQQAKGDNAADVMNAQTQRLAVEVDMFNAKIKAYEAETKRGDAIIGAVQQTRIPQVQPGAPAPQQTTIL